MGGSGLAIRSSSEMVGDHSQKRSRGGTLRAPGTLPWCMHARCRPPTTESHSPPHPKFPAEAWAKRKTKVLTVTPGWSEAYGLFTKGEAPMVLSYTTSPAYHMVAENTERYQAASFEEGEYLQIEVAGITTTGAKNPLAQKFIAFMTGPKFQDVIPETNWMFPAGKTDKPLNPAFGKLVKPAKTLPLTQLYYFR